MGARYDAQEWPRKDSQERPKKTPCKDVLDSAVTSVNVSEEVGDGVYLDKVMFDMAIDNWTMKEKDRDDGTRSPRSSPPLIRPPARTHPKLVGPAVLNSKLSFAFTLKVAYVFVRNNYYTLVDVVAARM